MIVTLEDPAFLSFLLIAIMVEPAEDEMSTPLGVAAAGGKVIRGENMNGAGRGKKMMILEGSSYSFSSLLYQQS